MWSYPTHNRNFQKNSKKIQKFRKYHHSFVSNQNRLGKATKERKGNKSFRCVSSRPVIEHSIKMAKKLKKLKKHHLSFFTCQNRLGKTANESKLKKSFRCVSTRPVIEGSKKIAKKLKNLENTIIASFLAKIGWERLRMREKAKNRSVVFLPDP